MSVTDYDPEERSGVPEVGIQGATVQLQAETEGGRREAPTPGEDNRGNPCWRNELLTVNSLIC